MPISSPSSTPASTRIAAGAAAARSARLRQEGARILGVQPHLDRVAARAAAPAATALGDPQLLLDEVEAGHRLGDRMLDLDPAVQLEEVELAALEDELGRARADVPDRTSEANGGLAHPRSELRVERHRRRLLEHLLVAALHRALALAEARDGAVRVGEQLDLDVARPLEVALEEQPVVAERRSGLAARLDGVVELPRAAHDAHASAAAAGGGLDEQREAELCGLAAGDDGNAGLAAIRFASSLSPPARSASGGGPTQTSPASATAAAKSGLSARKP